MTVQLTATRGNQPRSQPPLYSAAWCRALWYGVQQEAPAMDYATWC